jgi:hypothetical protein
MKLSTTTVFFEAVIEICRKVINVTIKPNILVADNAGAITNGFKNIFELDRRVNCWAHMIRKIDERLRSVKQHKEAIRNDVISIQGIFDKDHFNVACKLFLKNGNRKHEALMIFWRILKTNGALKVDFYSVK